MRDGHAVGVRLRDGAGDGELVEAGAVVLATGGLGALFAHTTNPMGSCGAGLALAMAAGARGRDLEFVQFHPTALRGAGPTLPLITEALRGAGAVLRDDRGPRPDEGPAMRSATWPRATCRPARLAGQRDGPVWLDATGAARGLAGRFPDGDAVCQAHGIDPRDGADPGDSAAHFHMGGVATDADGRTCVPVCMPSARSRATGCTVPNRLASNSLLEGVVYGRRLGLVLAQAGWRHRGQRRDGAGRVGRGPCSGPAALAAHAAVGRGRADALRRGPAVAIARVDAMAGKGWQARLRGSPDAAHRRRRSIGAHWRDDARGRTICFATSPDVRTVARSLPHANTAQSRPPSNQ